RWLLIHGGDGSTTAPVELPELRGPILPLYRPDGALAGIVAIDAADNLNFYPDETFANPRLLVPNIGFFMPGQEAKVSPIAPVSTNPTYAFLAAQQGIAGSSSIYRVDYTGAISTNLYDADFSNGIVVASDTLYFTDVSGGAGAFQESVRRISGSGPVELLGSTIVQQASWLPI